MSDKIVIIRGQTKTINAFISLESTEEPVDLTNQTSIKAFYQKDDNTLLEKNTSNGITVVSALGGKIQIALTAADTGSLEVDERLDWELEVTLPSETHIFQFNEELDVLARLTA